MTRGVLRSSVLGREPANREIVLGGVEDVAAASDVEQEAQRGALEPDVVRDAHREVRLAIIAVVDERARPEREARGRIDQELALVVPQVEQPGQRHRRQPRLRAVADVAVQPRVGDVRLRQRVRQRDRLAARPREVDEEVPREVRVQHRRAAHDDLGAFVLRRRAVQVEQNEARCRSSREGSGRSGSACACGRSVASRPRRSFRKLSSVPNS